MATVMAKSTVTAKGMDTDTDTDTDLKANKKINKRYLSAGWYQPADKYNYINVTTIPINNSL